MDTANMHALFQKITVVSDAAARHALMARLRDQSRAEPLRLAFINAHAFNMACKNKEFYDDLMSCDVLLRDGAGMKILFALMGHGAGLNMNGTDFIPRLLDFFGGGTIALYGTTEPFLSRAAEKIRAKNFTVSDMKDGFLADAEYKAGDMNSDIVLLAMGMPKQERVAQILAGTIPKGLIVCGGAILDFLGRKVSRAPELFQKAGLEWLYRLAQEPRRLFKRYVIGNAEFLFRAARLCYYRPKPDLRRLKILHVVRQYAPSVGGLEIYVRNLCRYQKEARHDCTVLTLDKIFHGHDAPLAREEVIDTIPVRRVSFFGKRRFFIPYISPFYFRRFDIVHVHNTDIFYDYAGLSCALLRVPAFATTHGGFFHTDDFSLIKTIYFNTITRISSLFYKTLFAISGNDFETFRTLNKNILLLPNAVEPLDSVIHQGSDFIYIGRLAQNKNIPGLLSVFAAMKARGVTGRLHIVGPAWDVDMNELITKANALSLKDDVIFHGSLEFNAIRNILPQCGFFISASKFEGFGMSMLEAMGAGLIPLVHNNAAFAELVEKSGVGVSTDFAKADEAAAVIQNFLSTLKAEMRERAQNFARLYSWPTLSQRIEEAYHRHVS
jgi:alpha-1,3-mannosyltransferase